MGSWSVRGGHAIVTAGGQPQGLVSVFVEGDNALPISILLQRTDLDANAVDPANTDSPVIARIKFGSQRVADFVEVDVESGTVITVPWGSVEVDAFYEPDPQAGAVTPDQRVQASAYVGARQGGVRPTRQRRMGVLGAGSRTVVPVPAYAADVAVYGIPAAQVFGVVSLQAYRAPNGRAIAEWTPTDSTPARIPNGTRSILVVSPNTPLVVLEFGLCL